jgi:hypothetical protein
LIVRVSHVIFRDWLLAAALRRKFVTIAAASGARFFGIVFYKVAFSEETSRGVE